MAPKSQGNRIEVDLQLMQAEAIDKLQKFGKDFNNTIDRLANLLDNASEQLGQGSVSGGAGVGPSASTSTGTDQAMRGVQKARQGGQDPQDTILNVPSGGPSRPEDTVEQQMARMTKRIGGEAAVPVGLRQTLGYIAEGQFQLPANPFSRDTWQRTGPAETAIDPNTGQYAMSRKQVLARHANDLMFNYQALKANMMLGMNKYSNFWGGISSLNNVGTSTDANLSRTGANVGWFNLPFGLGSPAMMHGLNESLWQPLVSSTFGLNGAYSLGQAQAARQAINEYGWSSSNMGDWLANVLKQNTIRGGTDPQTQMAFLDPMLRYGGNSFDMINTVLQQIPSAATAAGYNLQQFTQQLLQTATAVAQQTGLPMGTIASGITAISSTTGLPPTQVGELMNTQNILMAAGTTHTPYWDIMYGGKQGALLARPLTVFESTLQGHSPQQVAKWFSGHGTKAQQETARRIMGQTTLLYQQDPQIFGGMNPTQALHTLVGAGSIKGLVRQTNLQSSMPYLMQGMADTDHNRQVLDQKIEHILGNYYPGNKSRDKDLVKQYMAKSGGYNMSNRRALAAQLMRSSAPNDRQKLAKYMIDLTPDAKKLITLMGGDASHTNSGSHFSRWSSEGLNSGWNYGNDVVPVVGGAVGAAVGGLGGAVAGGVGDAWDAIF